MNEIRENAGTKIEEKKMNKINFAHSHADTHTLDTLSSPPGSFLELFPFLFCFFISFIRKKKSSLLLSFETAKPTVCEIRRDQWQEFA